MPEKSNISSATSLSRRALLAPRRATFFSTSFLVFDFLVF